jgi:hypothetical protein
MAYDTKVGLSGAASGATSGAMIGGPWGAVAGGVLGGLSGFMGGEEAPSPMDIYKAMLKKLYPGMVRDSKTFLAEGRKRIGQDVIQRGLNNTTVVPTLNAKLENMAAQRLQESKDRLLQQAFGMWPQVASQYGQQTNPMMGLLGQFGQLGGQLYGDKLYNDRLAALTRPNQPNMSLGQSPLSGFSSSLRLTP